MFQNIEYKIINDFDVDVLHKKIGQMLVVKPTDSDIQEGVTKTIIYFVDSDRNFYVIDEYDESGD